MINLALSSEARRNLDFPPFNAIHHTYVKFVWYEWARACLMIYLILEKNAH